MKFEKEMTIVFKGELFDKSLTPEDVIKRLKISYQNWWVYDLNWIYGPPSDVMKGGIVTDMKIIYKE